MGEAASNRFGFSGLDALKAKAAQPARAASDAERVQRISLALIDEDPNQPRRHFDEAALRTLADSIARPDTGLQQPVTLRAAPGGRFVITYGARRVRAVRMLGWTEIPAIVRDDEAGIAGQVIENRQRQDNTDSELADAVAILTAQGHGNAEIATVLALTDAQSVRYYRALAEVRRVPELAGWIDRADARALYELHLAWQRDDGAHRPAIAAALGRADEITVTSARRIVAEAKAAAETTAAATRDAPPGPGGVEIEAVTAGDTPPVQAADTIAPQADAAATRPARRRSAPAHDDDPAEAERVAKVRAWLDSPRRPRPPLNV